MELLTSLPADLLAVGGPLAPGGAPLLRPTGPPDSTCDTPISFDAFLAVLTAPLPAGEAWPAAGKELPAAALGVAGAAPGSSLDPVAFETAAPDDALFARLRFALSPSEDTPARVAVPGLPLHTRAPTPTPPAPPSNGSQAAVLGAFVAEAPIDAELAAAVPSSAEAALLEAAEPAAQGARAEPLELASWPDVPASSDAPEWRPTATPNEPRPIAMPSPASAAAPAALIAQPAAEGGTVAANGLPRNEAPKISPPPGVPLADATNVTRPEWVASPSAGATSAAPAPTATSTPVDMRAPGWQETFANRAQWLVDSNVGEARITLHPPELGAVDIEISLVDDRTYVQLTASTAAARDELSQSLPRLRELFTVSGLELGGASVHDGRDGRRSGNGDGAAPAAPRSLPPLADLGDEAHVAARARSLGRIDVFA